MRPTRNKIGVSRGPHLRASAPEWYERIGNIARSIGNDRFHTAVARLLGDMVPHDYIVIVRYPVGGLPDILFTQNFGQHLIAYYLQHAFETTDPFYGYWHATGRSGVLPLSEALRYASDRDFYPRIYQPKLGIADEVAVLLAGMGGACLGIFLGRRRSRFGEREIDRLRLVFPCIEGLHKAHVGRLFTRLAERTKPHAGEPFPWPTLIVTRTGEQVYSNPAWRSLSRKEPALDGVVRDLGSGRSRKLRLPSGSTLHMEKLDSEFALAPGGRMFTVEAGTEREVSTEAVQKAAADFDKLTPRERQIVGLIVTGTGGADVARKLGLSKGTIKNHRLRIYKKLDISSERALLLRFLPLAGRLGPEARPGPAR